MQGNLDGAVTLSKLMILSIFHIISPDSHSYFDVTYFDVPINLYYLFPDTLSCYFDLPKTFDTVSYQYQSN